MSVGMYDTLIVSKDVSKNTVLWGLMLDKTPQFFFYLFPLLL